MAKGIEWRVSAREVYDADIYKDGELVDYKLGFDMKVAAKKWAEKRTKEERDT